MHVVVTLNYYHNVRHTRFQTRSPPSFGEIIMIKVTLKTDSTTLAQNCLYGDIVRMRKGRWKETFSKSLRCG